MEHEDADVREFRDTWPDERVANSPAVDELDAKLVRGGRHRARQQIHELGPVAFSRLLEADLAAVAALGHARSAGAAAPTALLVRDFGERAEFSGGAPPRNQRRLRRRASLLERQPCDRARFDAVRRLRRLAKLPLRLLTLRLQLRGQLAIRRVRRRLVSEADDVHARGLPSELWLVEDPCIGCRLVDRLDRRRRCEPIVPFSSFGAMSLRSPRASPSLWMSSRKTDSPCQAFRPVFRTTTTTFSGSGMSSMRAGW